MRFGIFTEFECPRSTSEATVFDTPMAQMAAAEAPGFDAVWLGELHFRKDRSVPGDLVEVENETIGALRNRVTGEA
jgi:hypothetical protein